MLSEYLQAILTAKVYDVANITPLQPAEKLSDKLQNRIMLKREDLQPIFSFKLRGAYNKISQLSEKEQQAGVICASAGNHAQGVAFSASKLKLSNLIVMPTTTPAIKIQAVKRLGGCVSLYGDSFDQANQFALKKAASEGLTYIAPYDDALVIAGQGTVALELLQQWREVDYVFVPTGGGGLLAGVAAFFAAVAPHIEVVAVEPSGAACLKTALECGKPVSLSQVSSFADGVAVAKIGQLPFELLCASKADGRFPLIYPNVVCCSNDEICAAIKDVYNDTRAVVETAGALAVAGMKKFIKTNGLIGKNCVAIVSGANMDFDRLRYIAERAEVGEQKEAIFAVALPEQAGAFLAFCQALADRNITEFNYRFNASNPTSACVFVGVGLSKGDQEKQQLIAQLQAAGYAIDDLTDDEMAKTHVRYLIGGHANVAEEKLFRVMFPERIGALRQFLETLGREFNITLFHYRNHGAAEGRVLVGLQASAVSSKALCEKLREMGYACEELSDNLAYERFLK